MSARHTPGPWAVFERGIRAGSICTIVHRVKWWACGLDESEEMANARLIAASPDLLSALQDLLNDDAKECIPSKKWDKARAAIAKATGDTP
jgi:hypothetical protein